MLPAAKIFVVTALLGGGAVGTYALAGGKFGTGGNGSGNAETTTQVTAQPSAPVPGVAPAVPSSETLPAAEAARDGDNSLGDGVQQTAGVSSDDQTQQRADLQTSDQVNSRDGAVDIEPSGDQEVTARGKSELEVSGTPENPGSVTPEKGALGALPEVQQETLMVNQESDNGVNGLGTVDQSRSKEQIGSLSPADPNVTPSSSNPGDTEGRVENIGDGAKGPETVTASGEEETRTASGEESS